MTIFKILILFLYLFSNISHCLEAVVISPRTELFLSESEQSEISEYRVKGDIIYIHGFYNIEVKNFNDELNLTKFYKSIDRIGRPVFVKSQDVVVYFEDNRELDSIAE